MRRESWKCFAENWYPFPFLVFQNNSEWFLRFRADWARHENIHSLFFYNTWPTVHSSRIYCRLLRISKNGFQSYVLMRYFAQCQFCFKPSQVSKARDRYLHVLKPRGDMRSSDRGLLKQAWERMLSRRRLVETSSLLPKCHFCEDFFQHPKWKKNNIIGHRWLKKTKKRTGLGNRMACDCFTSSRSTCSWLTKHFSAVRRVQLET